jgi:hypothetical protein
MFWPTKKRKPTQPETPERDIFEFWDGNEMRRIDPLPVWYKLWQTEDIESILKRAENLEAEAVEELAAITREVFGVEVYDPETETGLTCLETKQLFFDYLVYCQELKKKVGPLPIPWRIQAQWISSAQSTTPPAAESSSSQSGSPSDEPSTACTPSAAPSTTA